MTDDHDRLLTPDQAASILAVQTKTLSHWRYTGEGPAYTKVGRLVRYRRADLDAWVDAQTVTPGGSQ